MTEILYSHRGEVLTPVSAGRVPPSSKRSSAPRVRALPPGAPRCRVRLKGFRRAMAIWSTPDRVRASAAQVEAPLRKTRRAGAAQRDGHSKAAEEIVVTDSERRQRSNSVVWC